MENYEVHKDLFDLPRYVFPIALVCFGYPTRQQQEKPLTRRFDSKFVVFENQYSHLDRDHLREMYRERQEQTFGEREEVKGARNLGQLMYTRKFDSDFAREMNRSVRAILKTWTGD